MAFSSVFLTCSWLTTSAKDCGRYFLAITWYIGWVSGCRADNYARPRVIRGTRTAPLPLLPSGPGGVCGRPLHEARDLTSLHRNMAPLGGLRWACRGRRGRWPGAQITEEIWRRCGGVRGTAGGGGWGPGGQ